MKMRHLTNAKVRTEAVMPEKIMKVRMKKKSTHFCAILPKVGIVFVSFPLFLSILPYFERIIFQNIWFISMSFRNVFERFSRHVQVYFH